MIGNDPPYVSPKNRETMTNKQYDPLTSLVFYVSLMFAVLAFAQATITLRACWLNYPLTATMSVLPYNLVGICFETLIFLGFTYSTILSSQRRRLQALKLIVATYGASICQQYVLSFLL